MLKQPVGATDRRVDRLLALLMEHPMVVLSGAKIARQGSVSRSAVWRWVEKLRGLGVKIKGHPKSGYRLERIPDILVPQLLAGRLQGTPFARRIHHFFRLGSTNQLALELAAAGESHGAVVLAEEQTAGRGRLGRAWHSEKTSGIYVSVILRPALAPQQAPLLTLAAGLAAHDAVEEVTGLQAELKWPNDLLLGGKKVCGILTEMQAEAYRVNYVVVGIGINVNHARLPKELEASATSLRLAAGRDFSRLDLLAHLLAALDRHYNRLRDDGPASLRKRFEEAAPGVRGLRVRVASQREEFTGVTAGLDESGCLLVRRDPDGALVPVLAADVTEVE